MAHPAIPQRRRPIRSENIAENDQSDNKCQELYMNSEQSKGQNSLDELIDKSMQQAYINTNKSVRTTEKDLEVKIQYEKVRYEEVRYKEIQKQELTQLQNQDLKINSPEKRNVDTKTKLQSSKFQSTNTAEQNTKSTSYVLISCIIIVIVIAVISVNKKESLNKGQTQSINSAKSVLESIENIKTRFKNQDTDIWNDISSGLNEVITRNPKTPSIILLFANETTTMDCLASTLADVSSTILGSNSPLYLEPKDFGDDPGDIIHTLKKRMPTKRAVIIRDVLNINAKAIKALHNLCDRINPLIGEIIYIITMQTKDYESSQKKLAFVEEQIYYKLSENIDQDILMALVARITDGIIVSVQPEPNLRYCS